MISDLGRGLKFSVASKYADDTKNTAKIGNTDDAEKFQRELDEIVYPWAPRNNMCLNGDKFEHHRIGDNLNIEKHSYTDPNGEVIGEKEYIKDLGVYISSDLTWTKQIKGETRGLTREPCIEKVCYNTFGIFGVGRIRPSEVVNLGNIFRGN